jgi:formylglycine-generating enzyme required for sulfatase activity
MDQPLLIGSEKQRKQRRRHLAAVCAFIIGVIAVYQLVRSPTLQPWAEIPAGTYRVGSVEQPSGGAPRSVELPGFHMQRTEVTVGQFVRFLNTTRPDDRYESPQVFYAWGRYHARVDRRRPVAHVSYADAEAFAAWLSRKRRVDARLPAPDEWEIAARGGVDGLRYPWGWDHPQRHARFQSTRTKRVGRYQPNAAGLYDMAGNVAEWCAAPGGETAFALGGSYAENEPDLLHPSRRTAFPKTYRDADVGFRLVH